MNFLRTLFWIVLTVVIVVFALHNWITVTLDLFGGLQADVKLPVLLLIAFLLGLVPTWAYFLVRRWQAGRRTAVATRVAADPPAPAPVTPPDPIPPLVP